MPDKPFEPRSWEDFRAAGLLWFVNSLLHTFGWAIVVDDDGAAYPARTTLRGFDASSEDAARLALSRHLRATAADNHQAAYPGDE